MPGQTWSEDEVKELLELRTRGYEQIEISVMLSKEFNRVFTVAMVDAKLRRIDVATGKPPKTYEELVDIEKAEARKRQRERAKKKDIQEQARWEMMCETIKDAVKPLDFIQTKQQKLKSKTHKAEQAVLLISDIHIGKKTPKYNLDISGGRIAQLVASVMDIITIHRHSYPVDTLNIFWAGDIVDGEGIYRNQAHYLDAHVVDQIFGLAPIIVDQLAHLASSFERVNNICVRGNHGRVSREAHDESNYDRIFYKVLETATLNIKNMKWDIPGGWHALTKIFDTRFLIIHGNQIRMTLNLPWYGITTRVSRWAATEGISNFDVICMGHFHSSSVLRWSQKRIFTNGTLIDGDEFALENLGLESSQSQWLFGVHPKRGTTWDYEIRFD